MSNTIQIRVKKEDVEMAVEKYLYQEVKRICSKQKVSAQIELEIEEAAISVLAPDYDERIKRLEKKLEGD